MAQTLLVLLQNSHSLSDADKQRLSEQLPLMTVEEQQSLEGALMKEAARVKQIEDQHQSQSHILNEEYERTVSDFKTHTLKTIRSSTEQNKRTEEMQKIDEALNSA